MTTTRLSHHMIIIFVVRTQISLLANFSIKCHIINCRYPAVHLISRTSSYIVETFFLLTGISHFPCLSALVTVTVLSVSMILIILRFHI